MNIGQINQLSKEMLVMTMYLGGPVIIAGMIVGLVVSIVQTVTQIQEQSISFVVKMVASAIALLVFTPWMLIKITDFTTGLLGNLDKFIR